MQCPKGHPLPFTCKNGARCTHKWCGETPFNFSPKLQTAADPEYDKTKANRFNTQNTLANRQERIEAAVEEVGEVVESDFSEAELREKVGKLAKAERGLMTTRDTLAKVRTALSHKPDNLNGAEAEEWADNRLVKLLPDAVAEIEYQLLRGSTDEQRMKAARQVLESTGRGKVDKAASSNTPIIMLNMSSIQLPWQQNAPKMVEAQIVPPALPDSDAKK